MKLYYSPGACSLSPHIVLEEMGQPYQAIAAPTKTHRLEDGTDYYTINPLGYVPYLVLDDGRTLHEGPAIVQYLADQAPEKNLAPPNGSWARYKLIEWLNFLATELHKGGFSPLFNASMPDAAKALARERLLGRLDWLASALGEQAYLLGETFSVADAYLFTILGWGRHVGVDLAQWPTLAAYHARVAQRPAVQTVLRAEGLTR